MRSLEAALARSALSDYLGVRPGEPVTVESWSHAVPCARAFVVEARRLGAEPLLVVEDEDGFFTSLAQAGRRPVPRSSVDLADRGGSYVYFDGPEEFPRLFGLRAEELAAATQRHGPAWEARARSSGLRAVRMAISGATPTAASRFGVRLEAWRQELLLASLVSPRRLAATAAARLRGLRGAKVLRLRHGNGTDLTVRLRPGGWLGELGRESPASHRGERPWSRIPTGTLTIPIAPGSAEGTWETNRPEYDRYAVNPVGRGGRFVFARGRLADAGFDRGGEGFARLFQRGRSLQGAPVALRFGLNPKVGRAPEIGELALGTVGLVLAAEATGASPASSGPTYAALLAGAQAELDGRRWLEEGRPVPS